VSRLEGMSADRLMVSPPAKFWRWGNRRRIAIRLFFRFGHGPPPMVGESSLTVHNARLSVGSMTMVATQTISRER